MLSVNWDREKQIMKIHRVCFNFTKLFTKISLTFKIKHKSYKYDLRI